LIIMRDSQNSRSPNEGPPAPVDEDVPKENDQPAPKSYYYDDATGYEIYRETEEPDEREELGGDAQTEG
jgi:hypothetical protein